MKRSIIIISLCALALSASAQFKVQSSGTYFVSCNTGGKSGITVSAISNNNNSTVTGGQFTAVASTKAVGIQGIGNSATTSIGVLGTASSDSGTKSIGILGGIYQSIISTGAAVYGTVYNDMGTGLSTGDKYAGFFRGNVKATGSIVAGSTIQGALLGESASSSNSSEGGQSLRGISMANNLSGLNVTTYQKERPAMPVEEETIFDPDGDSSKVMETPEPDIIDEQFYTKSHYALDADKLEEVFPDLVYVNKDGSKVINYVEMIPLLVQSINELNEKIEVLQGQSSSGRAKAAVRSTTVIDGSSISQNKLYQNTPNPFKEKTTIHFTLADDARDAYICIFDMTGKPVKKLPVSSGMDSVSFRGYEIGEGMFLYSLIVNGQEIDTKRMIIRK
jgi:hypothetical protein